MHPLGAGEVMGSIIDLNYVIDVKIVPTTLSDMRYSMSMRNVLAQNRRNSLTCRDRTSRRGSCKQRIDCLQKLGSEAFGPFKLFGSRLLSTVT